MARVTFTLMIAVSLAICGRAVGESSDDSHAEHHGGMSHAVTVFEYTENATTASTSIEDDVSHMAATTRSPVPSAEALKWHEDVVEAHGLSSCYSAINFHILDSNGGRIDVNELETVQFSLSLNKTSSVYTDSTSGGCSVVWVRIDVGMINNIETAALVDNNNNPASDDLAESRVIALHRGARFPTRNYARGIFLGYAHLRFQALSPDVNTSAPGFNASSLPESSWVTFRSGKIATFRIHRPLDLIFQLIIFSLIIFGNVGIGLNVNWQEIIQVLKRPIGPAIGFCCQYIVMPLAGFTLVKLIDLPPNVGLGIFLIGCAPGGGGSNYHTYFLGGSLPLSVTMTFISTIAAIGMMPLWVFTLGKMVLNESQSGVTLDFKGILASLGNSILPFLVGILINWWKPIAAKRIFNVVVRPLLFFIFLYMITMGLFTNMYIFKLMKPRVLLAGVCLPYVGFSLGFVVALLCRQGLSFAVTIAIETGIQSVGIAFTTLYLSLPQPDADIAIVGPTAVAMFTPVPLWIAEICRGVYLCVKKGRCFVFDTCRERMRKGKEDAESGGEEDDSTTEEGTSFSKHPLKEEEEIKPTERSVLHQPPKHVTPDRDSALQPLLSPVIESPTSEVPSIRDSAMTTESEVSTVVPQGDQAAKQPSVAAATPTSPMRPSSSSTSSGNYDNVDESIDVGKKTTRPGLSQDPRSIESIYLDAEQGLP